MSSIVRSQPNSSKKKFHQMPLYLLNVEFMFESKKDALKYMRRACAGLLKIIFLLNIFLFFPLL